MLYMCELYINGKIWDYGVFDSETNCLNWCIPLGLKLAKEKNCSWDYSISEFTDDWW